MLKTQCRLYRLGPHHPPWMTKRRRHEMTALATRLEDLPGDTFNNVLLFLFLEDLYELSFVSQRMNTAVSTTSHLFSRWKPGRRALTFSPEGFQRLMVRFQGLSVLHLSNLGFLGDDLFTILNESAAASSLCEIVIRDCHSREWRPVLLDMPNLTRISISGLFSEFDLVTSSPCLRWLEIRDLNSFTDQNFHDLLRNHPSIECLTLENALGISKPILKSGRLENLSIRDCSILCELPNLSCPRLRSLHVSLRKSSATGSPPFTGNKIMEAVESLPSLEDLQLSFFRMTNLSIHSPSLKTLDLHVCDVLESIELLCPNLKQFTGDRGSLAKLHIAARHIKVIDLSLCRNLVDLELEMMSLEHLNLLGCHRLTADRLHFRCDSIGKVNIGGTSLSPRLFPGALETVGAIYW